MSKNIFKVVFFVGLATSFICNTIAFDCTGLDTAACKSKFGNEFLKDFKALNLNTAIKIFTSYVDTIKTIRSELPTDNAYIKTMDEIITNINKDLVALEDEADDQKIAKTIHVGFQHMSFLMLNDLPATDELKKLANKYNLINSLIDRLNNLTIDVGNLWAEKYKGLREEDLNAYPEYADVNGLMNSLLANYNDTQKMAKFATAAEILDVKFGLPYFSAIVS